MSSTLSRVVCKVLLSFILVSSSIFPFFARKQREIVALPIFACKSVKCTSQKRQTSRRVTQSNRKLSRNVNEKQKIEGRKRS